MNPNGCPFQRKLLSLISSATQAEEPNIFPCSNVHTFKSVRVLQGGILVEHKANVGILSRAKCDSSVEAILWFESIEVRALPLICCNPEQNFSKIFSSGRLESPTNILAPLRDGASTGIGKFRENPGFGFCMRLGTTWDRGKHPMVGLELNDL